MIARIHMATGAALFAFLMLWFSHRAEAQQPNREVVVEDIEIRGNRRIPKESILYYVRSKPQDRLDMDLAQRDLHSIIQMGLFDPLSTKLYVEDGRRGGKVIIFQVKEFPIIRGLEYRNMKSATESEVLTRFKERRVNVSRESQFDPAKANGARVVLRELLAEKGHPDAKVEIEVEDISATAVALVFNVDEGSRVRVKEIEFTGDRDGFSQRRLRGAMKLIKESGLISTFTSKDIYFKEKLAHDLELVRFFLGQKGYLQAKIGDPEIVKDGTATGGVPLPIPVLRKSGPGLKISIPIEVGRRYKIASVQEKGVTIFQPGVVTLYSGLRKGEWIDLKKIQDNVFRGLKDLYGTQGYIQATPDFIPKFNDKTPEEGEVEITIDVDEGRQFTLRRLEFIGNTNTRDVVLRREVVVNEGDAYNKRYWDLSILKLNQLGLFDEIKERDAITRTNDRDQTVDIDLQVKERNRQQVQLNGGVSGFAGSFFGLEYTTNNLLGYGESLSIGISGGNRQQSVNFGFTEPYFMGKPISLGVSLFAQKYQYIGSGFNFGNAVQMQQASVFGLSSIDSNSLFTQKSVGGVLSLSSQLQAIPMMSFVRNKYRKFAGFTRVGISYSISSTSIEDPAVNRDDDQTNDIPVSFRQPKILTSRITPNLHYNSLNAYQDPTRGTSLYLGFALSGGVLGGDVNTFTPSLEYKYFRPVLHTRSEKPHVIGMRFRADHVRTFGKRFQTDSLSFVGGIPLYERFYLGGEYDIRGYNIRSISPLVRTDSFYSTRAGTVAAKIRVPNGATTDLVDPPPGLVDPSVIRNYTFETPENGCGETSSPGCNVVKRASFMTPIGGDTQFIYNLEYRVPIVGPLSAAAFADMGTTFNARKYSDQITKTEFINKEITGPVFVNPAGRLATADELANAPRDVNGNPVGYRNIVLTGDSRSFDIVRNSEGNLKGFLSDIRSSYGVELRIQMPVVNVPFRLIFAHNPQARTDAVDAFGVTERRTAVRFSVGRTF